ncbi:MAG: ribosome biogenesis GTPase Der [Candidatus Humimicrobiaceae bacterium]
MIDARIPKIAVVGRPNVGKSTLINRICKKREAIVHHQPMITRDRKYYTTDWNGTSFYLLDTGGIDLKSREKLSLQIYLQATKAIEEADIIIFLVDLKNPISPLDYEIAGILRKSSKPIILAGNKWDNPEGSYYTEDFLTLGFGYPIKISAMHGMNIGDLLDEVVGSIDKVFEKKADVLDEQNIPKIAILGKPNVGKSTLFNSIIQEERAIVDEVEGTTRDSIDSVVIINDSQYKFIDTAGIRKKKVREEDLEYYSKLRTIESIKISDICLVLIDCTKGITKQDVKIVDTCIENGVSICVVLNKIDLVEEEKLKRLVDRLDQRLDFAAYIPFLKISALKKKGIGEVIDTIDILARERNKQVTENKLMKLFKEIDPESAVYWKGKKFRIKFIKQVKTSPPIFYVFANMNIRRKNNIKKFMENHIRRQFGFIGTPIIFRVKY